MDDPKRLKVKQTISYVDLIASSIEMQIKMNETKLALGFLSGFIWTELLLMVKHNRFYSYASLATSLQISYGNLLGQVAYSVNLSLISSNVNYNRTKSHSDTATRTWNENEKKSFIELKCFCNSQDFREKNVIEWNTYAFVDWLPHLFRSNFNSSVQNESCNHDAKDVRGITAQNFREETHVDWFVDLVVMKNLFLRLVWS